MAVSLYGMVLITIGIKIQAQEEVKLFQGIMKLKMDLQKE
jgi:hypothetical protein